MKLRKARNPDVPQIRALINEMAARTDSDHKHGHMLPRSLTELYENIRDYTVLVGDDNRVLGCCALHSAWDELAELKALAVNDEVQGHGWGRKLVEAAISEADELGLACVFTLTNKMSFFEKLEFVPIHMSYLPQRVWSECVNCPKYDVACDEVAMTFRGCKPKQIFIPAVGVHAPLEARVALGLVPAELPNSPNPNRAIANGAAANISSAQPNGGDLGAQDASIANAELIDPHNW